MTPSETLKSAEKAVIEHRTEILQPYDEALKDNERYNEIRRELDKVIPYSEKSVNPQTEQ